MAVRSGHDQVSDDGFVVKENFGSKKNTFIHLAPSLLRLHVKHPGHHTGNTRWYGLFATYKEARKAAEDCGQPHGPFNCARCFRS